MHIEKILVKLFANHFRFQEMEFINDVSHQASSDINGHNRHDVINQVQDQITPEEHVQCAQMSMRKL